MTWLLRFERRLGVVAIMRKLHAVLTYLCFLIFPMYNVGQTKARTFEVVTIKPSDPGATDSRIDLENGNRFFARNVPLRLLVKIAYHLSFNADDQLLCDTQWFAKTNFDIDAKLDEATLSEMKGLDPDSPFNEVREMLKAALAERFDLTLHHETRLRKVDSLVAVKTGTKLQPSTSEAKPWTGIKTLAPGHLEGREATLDNLANALSKEPEVGGRIVTNNTHLQGKYDFVLRWSPDSLTGGQQTTSDPPLLSALREQLGLRLEPLNAPTDVLVVDRVSLPNAN